MKNQPRGCPRSWAYLCYDKSTATIPMEQPRLQYAGHDDLWKAEHFHEDDKDQQEDKEHVHDTLDEAHERRPSSTSSR